MTLWKVVVFFLIFNIRIIDFYSLLLNFKITVKWVLKINGFFLNIANISMKIKHGLKVIVTYLLCCSSLAFDSFMSAFQFNFGGQKQLLMLLSYSTKYFFKRFLLKSSLSFGTSLICQNLWWGLKLQSTLHNLPQWYCT